MIKTRVNNPDRVFLNSSDDTRTVASIGFDNFQCRYDTPILGAKRVQLLRATIPNAVINLPDYSLVFYYYQLPTATTAPAAAYLKTVRLYPSYYQAPAALGTAYTKNRFVSDPADFVTLLNAAASAGGDNVTYNPNWVQGDVLFAYNATTKQITMTGQTAGKFYAIAGWNDPNVNALMAANTIVMPNFTGGGTTPQPDVQNYTLNLRVGYCMSGYSLSMNGQTAAAPNALYANLTNGTFANAVGVPPDSFPNLVYTQCVYLYCDIVSGSGLGSGKQHNLLSVVPSNAPQLGVIQYTALTLNWMLKVPTDIYEITVYMRDDANQPLNLPDSAQVNIELAFFYQD